jgi:tetratricopeptide (TPR) repeat protein
MKRLIIAFLFLLIFITVQAQDSLQQAADAYEQGDYVTAIALYESTLMNGEGSGALYYNLGNAYYQYGNLGLAILNYCRATQYLPREKDIVAQINQARSERVDLTSEDSDWLNISANLSANILTLYEMSLIVFMIWLTFFILLTVSIKRNFWRIPAMAIGTILLMALLLLGSRFYVETQRPSAVVLSLEAQVWSGAGEDYLPLFTIYEAAEIRVLEKRGDWIKFALPDGRQGWMLEEHLGYITS